VRRRQLASCLPASSEHLEQKVTVTIPVKDKLRLAGQFRCHHGLSLEKGPAVFIVRTENFETVWPISSRLILLARKVFSPYAEVKRNRRAQCCSGICACTVAAPTSAKTQQVAMTLKTFFHHLSFGG
jgi:hypothetical protein